MNRENENWEDKEQSRSEKIEMLKDERIEEDEKMKIRRRMSRRWWMVILMLILNPYMI